MSRVPDGAAEGASPTWYPPERQASLLGLDHGRRRRWARWRRRRRSSSRCASRTGARLRRARGRDARRGALRSAWRVPDTPKPRARGGVSRAVRAACATCSRIRASGGSRRSARFGMGSFMAIQGLWAVPWMMEVEGLSRATAARHLLAMSAVILVGYCRARAVRARALARRGIHARHLFAVGFALNVVGARADRAAACRAAPCGGRSTASAPPANVLALHRAERRLRARARGTHEHRAQPHHVRRQLRDAVGHRRRRRRGARGCAASTAPAGLRVCVRARARSLDVATLVVVRRAAGSAFRRPRSGRVEPLSRPCIFTSSASAARSWAASPRIAQGGRPSRHRLRRERLSADVHAAWRARHRRSPKATTRRSSQGVARGRRRVRHRQRRVARQSADGGDPRRGRPYMSGPQWLYEHVLARPLGARGRRHARQDDRRPRCSRGSSSTPGSRPGFLIGGVPLDFRRVGAPHRQRVLRDRGRRVRHRVLRQALEVRPLPAAHGDPQQPRVRPRRHLPRSRRDRDAVPPPRAHGAAAAGASSSTAEDASARARARARLLVRGRALRPAPRCRRRTGAGLDGSRADGTILLRRRAAGHARWPSTRRSSAATTA